MKIGLISSPVPGHINPMSTVGRELKRRGHNLYFFNIADTEAKITSEGLNFILIGEKEFPKGSWEKFWVPLSKIHGISVVIKTILLHTRLSKMMVDDIPQKAQDLKLDALLIDQVQFQGKAIAASCKLPFISIACALHMDKDLSYSSPPPTSTRKFKNNLLNRLLNRVEWAAIQLAAYPLIRSGNPALKKLGMPSCRKADDTFSELAQIFPMPKSADFPGVFKSKCMHYVGSLVDYHRPQVAFDFSQISKYRPLIYASLGTLQNGIDSLYDTIISACKNLDVQVVISMGRWNGATNFAESREIPANIIIVDYAPQIQLLQKASLCITHGGTNTVHESLTFGVPLVVIPITNDQPAVAQRIAWSKVGKFLTIGQLSAKKFEKIISEVLLNPEYKNNALKVAQEIKNAGGVVKAADIIEECLQ